MSLRPVLRDVLRPVMRSPMQRGGRGGVDADAAAWAAAVTANGGTYSAAGLAASSVFVASAKAAGYWTKLNRINLFAGGGGTAVQNLAGCLVPLKVGGGGATDTNTNFVGGDYTEATGLTGNGSTKYLRTGLIPSVSLSANDTHLAVYNRSASGTGGGVMLGAQVAAAQTLTFYAPSTDGKAYSDSYSTAVELAGVLTTPYRLLIASRTGAAAHAIYQDGSSVASAATVAGTLPNIEEYIFAMNSAGSPALVTSHALAGYSIGSGLTAGDVTAYNTHMQTFQTALGRNV